MDSVTISPVFFLWALSLTFIPLSVNKHGLSVNSAVSLITEHMLCIEAGLGCGKDDKETAQLLQLRLMGIVSRDPPANLPSLSHRGHTLGDREIQMFTNKITQAAVLQAVSRNVEERWRKEIRVRRDWFGKASRKRKC